MAASTYLLFNGNCAEAMKFYQQVLGGKLDLMTYGDTPEGGEMPPHVDAGKIMHAHLALPDGSAIMASDDMSGAEYRGMSGFAIALNPKTADEAKRIFDALSEGGQIWMPLQATFWSSAFAMFADRFGTPWFVSADPAPAS
ncbi:MAG TPA: VOC family protein [Thermoanaerobaculia bacterium]|nr:VOC family protein [Thermoanaerobaculia bacterium]